MSVVLMSGVMELKNLPFPTRASSGVSEYPLSASTRTIPARVYGAIHHRGEVLAYLFVRAMSVVLMSGVMEPKNLPFPTQASSGIPEYLLSAFTRTIPARVYGAIHHRGEVLSIQGKRRTSLTILVYIIWCQSRRMKRSCNLLALTNTIPARVSAAFFT